MNLSKYNELKDKIRSGKGIQFEGRSAATVAELDWMATEVYGLSVDGAEVPEAKGADTSTPKPANQAKAKRKASPKKKPAKIEAVVGGETVDLTKMSVDQLREHAKSLGIEVTTRMAKGHILDAIAAKAKE